MDRDLGSAARRPPVAPDDAAFVRLLDELRPKLLMFVAQRGLAHAAEDVVQETLLAAITEFRAGKFEGRSSPATWVHGILRNKMGDRRRHDGRHALRFVPFGDDAASSNIDITAAGVLARPASQESSVLVHEVLESLPLRHWMVLMWNQREKLTTDEIAKIMHLSPGRVGAILAEAKQMFRDGVKGREDCRLRKRQTQ